jgi:hypothetical protein
MKNNKFLGWRSSSSGKCKCEALSINSSTAKKKKKKKQNKFLPGMVAHAHSPSYSGAGDREDCSSRPAGVKG